MPNMDHVQAELMDMITKDVSPSQISDKIKDMLFAKTSERVDAYKPTAADSLFGDEVDPEGSPAGRSTAHGPSSTS